jgi:hypothetical protein
MGGRPCTICTHPDRAAIEAAVVSGASFRLISSQFQVGYKSVERHAADHISQAIQQSQKAKEEAAALDVVQQLQAINSVSLRILQEARSEKEQFTETLAQLKAKQEAKEKRQEHAEEPPALPNMIDQYKILHSLQMLSLQAIDRVYKQVDLQVRLSLLPAAETPESQQDGIFLQLDQLSDQARAKIRLVLVEDEKRRAS